jgi:hypothetical protein
VAQQATRKNGQLQMRRFAVAVRSGFRDGEMERAFRVCPAARELLAAPQLEHAVGDWVA